MVECNCSKCQERKQENPCETLIRALKVMVLDQRHRVWMKENDPKALEQAEFAIDYAEASKQ
jgi:hypothetical protein